MKYRREIDGLRALAVLPVILFHAGFTFFSGGFVGVDIFFVISGYLITTIIVGEMEKSSFSLLDFYERRARRILPALFFVMLCTLPFAWYWMLPQDLRRFSQSLVAVPIFASNILFYLTSGYFEISSELKPLLHTWSLAVEEQYYFLFPVFLMLAWKLGKKWIMSLLLLAAIGSLLVAQWGATTHASLTFYLLPTRGFEILIGALISLFFNHREKPFSVSQNVNQTLSAAGLILIIYAIFAFDKNTPSPSLYTLIPTIGAALILVFSNPKNLVGKILGSKLLVGIGLISYSAYLWHQPLLAFTRYVSISEPSSIVLGAMATTSLIMAFFSWKYIERPFRDKQKVTPKQIFTFAILGSLVFMAIGFTGYTNGGFANRIPTIARDDYLYGDNKIVSGSIKSDNSCIDKLKLSILPEEVCLASSKEPSILFIGDSHAMALYSSIFGNMTKINALLISGHSCPTYPELTYKASHKKDYGNNCTNISNETIRVAQEFQSLKTVVIVNYFHELDNEESMYQFYGNKLSNREAFIRGYSTLIQNLLALKKDVVFVIDVPQTKFQPKFCLQKLPHTLPVQTEIECRFTKEEHNQIRKKYIDEVYKLKEQFPALIIYNPTELFCTGQFCEITTGTRSLYNDDHHVSIYGSELILKSMRNLNILQE